MTDLVAGDTASVIQVTCVDKDTDVVINLTGSTVKIRWESDIGAVIEKSMTIINPLLGTCSYQFVADELYAPAISFEVIITDATTKVVTSVDLVSLIVRPRLT